MLLKVIAFSRFIDNKKYLKDIDSLDFDFFRNYKISADLISKAEDEYIKTIDYGGKFLPIFANEYPDRLKQIPNPPILLTYFGNVDLLNDKIIAMVGSRSASYNGLELAENFAKFLSNAGYIIASGLAKGIDARAHIGAIKNTIAVIGSGINIRYPSENHKLYDKILENNSCIITEFAFDVKPIPANFPQRNRIIAGLCLASLIVEAGMQSGSLSTARLTMEYNREVFAIPGFAMDPKYKGNNFLIKKNIAKLVESPDEIIDEVKDIVVDRSVRKVKNIDTNLFNFTKVNNAQEDDVKMVDENDERQSLLSDNEEKILSVLSSEYLDIDTICIRTKMMAHEVNTYIVSLEMQGFVKSNGLGHYCKIFKKI